MFLAELFHQETNVFLGGRLAGVNVAFMCRFIHVLQEVFGAVHADAGLSGTRTSVAERDVQEISEGELEMTPERIETTWQYFGGSPVLLA